MGLFKKRDTGEPTPPASQSVEFGKLGGDAKGVTYETIDLRDGATGVTESANTGANTEETWLEIANDSLTAMFIDPSISEMLVDLETSAPAQITSGELSFWLANNDKSRTRRVNKIDLKTFSTLANQLNALYKKKFPFRIALAPNHILIVKVKSGSTLATANSTFAFSSVRQAKNCSLDDFRKHYADWIVT